MSVCKGCKYEPEGNFCFVSGTLVTRRFVPCASYTRDGLTNEERAINAYRKAKNEINEEPEEASQKSADCDSQRLRPPSKAD